MKQPIYFTIPRGQGFTWTMEVSYAYIPGNLSWSVTPTNSDMDTKMNALHVTLHVYRLPKYTYKCITRKSKDTTIFFWLNSYTKHFTKTINDIILYAKLISQDNPECGLNSFFNGQ